MLMDMMTDEIREEYPWAMMFADDSVICRESKEHVEEKLESWRYASERRGMQGNRMCAKVASDVVRVGDGGTDENTGGGEGGDSVEDVTIFIRSDTNGQDQE